MSYNFSGHEIYPGICCGIGLCDYSIPTPEEVAEVKPMREEMNNMDTKDNNEKVSPNNWGLKSSGMRIASTLSWMLQDYHELTMPQEGNHCAYVAPVILPLGSSMRLTPSHFRDESERLMYRATQRKVSLLPVYDDHDLDEDMHSKAELSGHSYSNVRLIDSNSLREQQIRSERDFFYEAVTHHEEVTAVLREAQYVFLPGSTVGIGMTEGDEGYGSSGGASALCMMLDECSMGNRAIFLSLVGATFNRFMKENFLIVLQYVDFLFLTELECRRLMIIINYDPNMTLEKSAQWLTNYAKIAGVRPRVVIVFPNPSLPTDFEDDPNPNNPDDPTLEKTSGGRSKAKFNEQGQQIFSDFKEYDYQYHFNTNELGDRIMISTLGEYFYIPGWPTASCAPPTEDTFANNIVGSVNMNASMRSGAHVQRMATYYYNAKLDFRLKLDATQGYVDPFAHNGSNNATNSRIHSADSKMESPRETELNPQAVNAADHVTFADNFIGGFIAMVVRAELQINHTHEELDSQNTSTSFIQGTVPNERMLEMAKERSVRLQRERERAWPGGHRPPPVATPKTATPQLSNPRQRASLDKKANSKTLFQTPQSRARNLLNTAGEPAVQLTIEAWDNHENETNQEYEKSLIKWASAGPQKNRNIVSGRRMLHDCIQAGLYALYDGNYAEEDYGTNQCRFFELFDDGGTVDHRDNRYDDSVSVRK